MCFGSWENERADKINSILFLILDSDPELNIDIDIVIFFTVLFDLAMVLFY